MFLQSNATGDLSWAAASGGATIATGSGATNRLIMFNASDELTDSAFALSSTGTLNFTGAAPQISFGGNVVFHTDNTTNVGAGVNSLYTLDAGTTRNIAIGNDAMYESYEAEDNVAIGHRALRTAGGPGGNYAIGHVAIGSWAMDTLNGSGALNNTGVGGGTTTNDGVLTRLTTGANNTALGFGAGAFANTTSSGNVLLGNQAGPTTATVITNKLYIDNTANNTPLIGGDFTANTVDINGSLNIAFVGGYLNYKPNNAECTNGDTLIWNATTDQWLCGAPSGGGGMSGTGTAGRIPKFSAATTLADSLIGENATAANREITLDGTRVLSTRGTRNLYLGNTGNNTFTDGSATDNVMLGNGSGTALTTGAGNILIGNYAGEYLTTSTGNVAIGYEAMMREVNGTGGNVAIGGMALKEMNGGGADTRYNTAVGSEAMMGVTVGAQNTAFGFGALSSGYSSYTTDGSTAVGYRALSASNPGQYRGNDAFGMYSLIDLTTGYNNTALGSDAGSSLTTGQENVFVGRNSGLNFSTSSSGNVTLGYGAGPASATAADEKLYIHNAASDAPLIGGDFSARTVTLNGSLNISRTGAYFNYRPDNTACTNGQALIWDNTNGRWICGSAGAAFSGTINRVVTTNGSGALQTTNLTNGQLLIGNANSFTAGTLTGTANQLTVTNGTGTITLSLPQNIHTAATPTFATPTANGHAVIKSYADGKLAGTNITTPAAGQNGQSIRWNNGTSAWEYFSPATAPALTADQMVVANGTGTAITSFACTIGQFLSFNGSGHPTCATLTLAGDVTGAYGTNTVTKLQGRDVANTAPTSGQFLKWSGTNWAPESDSGGSIVAAKSANYSILTTEDNYVFLVSGASTITLPTTGSVPAGFRTTIKRVGGSNIVVSGNGSNIDGIGTRTLASNYQIVSMINTGSEWIIISGGANSASGACIPGSQVYTTPGAYGFSITGAQATNCTFTISVNAAGGGVPTLGGFAGGVGGAVQATYIAPGSGTFDIVVGETGGVGPSYGGGGGRSVCTGFGGSGGGASGVSFNTAVLLIAGGGGGGGYNADGGAGGSGGNGSDAPLGANSVSGRGASTSLPGAAAVGSTTSGAGATSGNNGSAGSAGGVGGWGNGGAGIATMNIGGGGGGASCNIANRPCGGGGAGLHGGSGGAANGSGCGGGGGGSGYVSSSVTGSATTTPTASGTNGSVVIEWN